jgi:LPS sulfotransferase NodH
MHIRAVGFKIFYHHAQDDTARPLWDYLLDDGSIRVIHMKRRNLLKTLLSHKLAWLTGQWKQSFSGEPSDAPAITLSSEECEAEFRSATAQQERFDLRFGAHPHLNVVYEDLVKNFASEIERIEQFLGVARLALRPATVQQAKRPMAQQITNYYQLKEAFQQTPWASFFTE